jgi:hypothetical protein
MQCFLNTEGKPITKVKTMRTNPIDIKEENGYLEVLSSEIE